MKKQRVAIGFALWALAVLGLVAIPSSVWHYPDDLWLRVLVLVPAVAGTVLLLITDAKKSD